ncbi:MAG: amidohydrolase [Clostridia bacterium]|nr:amidohydrolase [Clostridia bacterium]
MGRYLFTGGKVYTASGRRPFCQALACVGKRVIACGTDSEAASAVDDSFERIDLGGKVLVPAFTDSHIHFKLFSIGLDSIDVEKAKAPEEAASAVEKAVEHVKPGAWIVGRGWNKNIWPGAGLPDRSYLDSVAPRNPVALYSKDLHAMWVNTAALRLAGVGIDTPNPEGGEIVRDDESRQASGILRETASQLVERVIPDPGCEASADAMERAQAGLHRMGIAGIHNMEGAGAFEALQLLRTTGRLKLRVVHGIAKDNLDDAIDMGLSSGFGDEWLKIGSLKLFADGALGSQTARLLRPYEGNPRNTGIEVTSKEEIAELVGRAVLAGISCAVHAIGDRANRDVLDILETVKEESARRRLRHRIEHAQLLHPEDVRRFADLGVVASMQPIHVVSDIPVADRNWGKRSRWAYAFRSLAKSGATLAFGSDAPVETPDPIRGIYGAVVRRQLDGTPEAGWYLEERLTVEEAVRAYTAGAAMASGDELTRGALSRGALADLAILSRDIFSIPAAEILEARVVATMVGGEFVYREGI